MSFDTTPSHGDVMPVSAIRDKEVMGNLNNQTDEL